MARAGGRHNGERRLRRGSPFAVAAPLLAVGAAALAAAACGIAAGSPKASTTTTAHKPSTSTTPSTVAPTTTTTTTPPATTTTTTVPAGASVALGTEVVKASRTGAHAYTVSCAHPVLSGAAGAGPIDAAFSATASNAVTSFEGYANGSAPVFPGAPLLSTLTCTWSQAWLSPTLGSVSFTNTDFMAGAAHPFATTTTFTFDPATGKLYALADLFRPRSGWLSLLTAQTRSLLSALPGYAHLGLPSDFGISQAKDFAAFELTSAGLQLTFQEYQVAPYSYGQPTITVPYSALSTVADPAGPLASMGALGS